MLTTVIVIFGIIALMTVVLNLLVIVAVLRDPLKKLRNMFSYLLLHLCVCNFIDGAVSLPVYMYSLTKSRLRQAPPLSSTTLVTHSIYAATIFSTFSLSVDRYVAICYPIYHRSNSSIKNVAFHVLGIWLCVFVEFIGYYFWGVRFRNGFQILTFTAMVVAVSFMYFRIRSVFNYHNHQEGVGDKNESLLLSSQSMIEERGKNERAILNTCKVIIGLQLITWLPILLVNCSEMLKPSLQYRELVLAICIANILSSIGHLTDPLVCILLLKNFKQSIKCLFVRNENQKQ